MRRAADASTFSVSAIVRQHCRVCTLYCRRTGVGSAPQLRRSPVHANRNNTLDCRRLGLRCPMRILRWTKGDRCSATADLPWSRRNCPQAIQSLESLDSSHGGSATQWLQNERHQEWRQSPSAGIGSRAKFRFAEPQTEAGANSGSGNDPCKRGSRSESQNERRLCEIPEVRSIQEVVTLVSRASCPPQPSCTRISGVLLSEPRARRPGTASSPPASSSPNTRG